MGKSEEVDRTLRGRQILEAGLEIFAKKGYNNTAVDEIAHRAGVAKGTLYLYFKDKEDIFYHVLMFIIDGLADLIKEDVREEMSPFDKLKTLALCYYRYFTMDQNRVGIFQTLLHDNLLSTHPRVFESLMEKKEALLSYISEIIENGKADGYIRSDIETEDIVNAYDGMVAFAIRNIAIKLKRGKSPLDGEKKIRSIITILRKGIELSSSHLSSNKEE